MKELKFNLKYLFNRKELYFAFLIVMWIHLIFLFTQLKSGLNGMLYPSLEGGAVQHTIFMVQDNMLYMLIYIAVPLACNMILSDASWKDIHENTGNTLYPRLDMRKNIIIRWILSILSTFIIVFLGFIVSYVVLISIFGDGYAGMGMAGNLAFDIEFLPVLNEPLLKMSPFLFNVIEYARISLIISLLVGFGYGISFFIKRKVMVYFMVTIFMIVHDLIFISINNIYMDAIFSGTSIPDKVLHIGAFAFTSQLNNVYYFWPTMYGIVIAFLLALFPLLFVCKRKDSI